MSTALAQGTNDWLEWRAQGIGSSEAPIIMGVSPYNTPLQLWEERTLRVKPEGNSWIKQKGTNEEPRARAWYEAKIGARFPADLAVHPKIQWMRASLDGYNPERRRILEIKYVGDAAFEAAKAGVVPEHHAVQMQHQLGVVAVAEGVDYLAWNGEEGVVIPISRNVEFIEKKLITAEDAFWCMILTDEAPDLTDRDFRAVKDPEVKALFENWKNAKLAAMQSDEAVEVLAARLKEVVTDRRVRHEGVQLVTYDKRGTVDWAKAAEDLAKLLGVTIDEAKYRKKGSVVRALSFVK